MTLSQTIEFIYTFVLNNKYRMLTENKLKIILDLYKEGFIDCKKAIILLDGQPNHDISWPPSGVLNYTHTRPFCQPFGNYDLPKEQHNG